MLWNISILLLKALADLQRTIRAEKNRQTKKMVRFNGFAES